MSVIVVGALFYTPYSFLGERDFTLFGIINFSWATEINLADLKVRYWAYYYSADGNYLFCANVPLVGSILLIFCHRNISGSLELRWIGCYCCAVMVGTGVGLCALDRSMSIYTIWVLMAETCYCCTGKSALISVFLKPVGTELLC